RPTLGSRVVASDRAVVERQLGRPPRAFRRVAVRCPFGRPAVTEQAAYDDEGEPFPTTFWLTCPHLVAAVSRLEAAGGVERWSRAAAADTELGASLDRANEEQRRLRPELDLGVGGAAGRRHRRAAETRRPDVHARPARRRVHTGRRVGTRGGLRARGDSRLAADARDRPGHGVLLLSARRRRLRPVSALSPVERR